MSWLQQRANMSDVSWKCLGFKPQTGCGFSIERGLNTPDKVRSRQLTTDEEWREWLKEDDLLSTSASAHRINLILGGRIVRPWGHDPMVLSQLPWSQPIFSLIANRFMVHSKILTAINRNTSCLFSHTETTWALEPGKPPVRAWIYNCRTSALWPGDMALSVTFLPDSKTTHAVLFGCDQVTPDRYDADMTLGDIITSRLANSDMAFAHPMLLPTVFADMERNRQIELVRDETAKLGERILKLASSTTDGVFAAGPGARKSDTSEKKEESSVMIWLGISKLRNGLEDWQRQLCQMIEHVDELNEGVFAVEDATKSGHHRTTRGEVAETKAQLARQEGARIRVRLQELVDEYDQYIRECTHIMDGMSLATQLELSSVSHMDSQVNLEVAQLTRRDGNLMKSIATLGMIFLPATFVTAFFSMGFFDWGDETMSRYIWVYVVAALATTFLTVALFYCLILRRWKRPRTPGTA